jgi:16S rRNA (cytidine1402-2'-O)-methyltransferase
VPLVIVPTPLGNLGDLTDRAREALAACDVVVAEDTRRTEGLLRHLGLHKPLVSLPAFDEAARAPALVERLRRGDALALVTDAGTPAISDPGALLVQLAVEAGVPLSVLPGPCAAVTAVSASGFLQGRFHFAGFLPRQASDRAELLEELRPLRAQLVFYEAPQRLAETLGDLRAALGDRPALVARELTKLHEELARGTLAQLQQRFSGEVRGEVVVVVSGAPDEAPASDPRALEELVRARLERGERPREIGLALALEHGRRAVYQLALRLEKELGQKLSDR